MTVHKTPITPTTLEDALDCFFFREDHFDGYRYTIAGYTKHPFTCHQHGKGSDLILSFGNMRDSNIPDNVLTYLEQMERCLRKWGYLAESSSIIVSYTYFDLQEDKVYMLFEGDLLNGDYLVQCGSCGHQFGIAGGILATCPKCNTELHYPPGASW